MKLKSQKIKTFLLLAVLTVSSFNLFTQNSSLISTCSDFIAGPNATWPHVLVATTLADSAASQAAQTYTMNVISLPAGGANVRVYKTTANGSNYFGNPVALTLGSNTITVAAVTFDRAVKFQFSSGDVEFDALSLNGADSECVCTISSSTDVVNGCDSYTWIDGNTYTSSNNTATHTLINAAGCDSVVTLDLTINNSTSGSTSVTACNSYIWDGVAYTISGAYTNIYTNIDGCDSVHTLNLIINNIYIVNNTLDLCYGDTVIVGNNIYTNSGVDTNLLTSVNGCDSTIITTITFSLDISINFSQVGNDILAVVSGGNTPYTYQWNTAETTDQITPNINGEYWVVITDNNGCLSDTSFIMVDWITTSVNDLFPNNKQLIKIVDLLGRESKDVKNQHLFYIYDDGTVEKKIIIE